MTVDITDDKERCSVVACRSVDDRHVAVLDFRAHAEDRVTVTGQGRVRLNRRQCQRLIAELQRLVDAAPDVPPPS
jgi:hypothetical protein